MAMRKKRPTPAELPAFFGFEVLALAELLWHRIRESDAKQKMEYKWEQKLPVLREAMMAGVMGKEAWPSEIVRGEIDVATETIRNLLHEPKPRSEAEARRRCKEVIEVRLSSDQEVEAFQRPFPAPLGWFKEIQSTKTKQWFRRSEQTLAIHVVCSRLNLSHGAVEEKFSSREEEKLRLGATRIQNHLAAVYLDLVADPKTCDDLVLQAMVLDALALSGYRWILLFYLTQCATSLKAPTASAPHKPEDVKRFCESAVPPSESGKAGPFTELLESQAAANERERLNAQASRLAGTTVA